MAIRFYYQFRDITEAEVRIAHIALKKLFKAGKQGEGALGAWCHTPITDDRWLSTLGKLEQYRLIEITNPGGRGRKVSLSGAGSDYAGELLGKEQTDGVDAEYKAELQKR